MENNSIASEEFDMESSESPPSAASQEAVDPLNTDELNKAAEMFTELIPRIKALSRNLGRNALSRVFNSLVEFPLGEKYPKFDNKNENELFVLSLSAMAYKAKMMSAVAATYEETKTASESAAVKTEESNVDKQ